MNFEKQTQQSVSLKIYYMWNVNVLTSSIQSINTVIGNVQSSGSQRAVCRPVALASPGNLLEIQTPGSDLGPPKSKGLQSGF